jgi:hypothetical protein
MMRKVTIGAIAVAVGTALSPGSAGAVISYGASVGAPLYDPFYRLRPSPPETYGTYSYAPVIAPTTSVTPHTAWCMGRFRSYNAATDMYIGFDGRFHRCNAPF